MSALPTLSVIQVAFLAIRLLLYSAKNTSRLRKFSCMFLNFFFSRIKYKIFLFICSNYCFCSRSVLVPFSPSFSNMLNFGGD